jgi:hypothetical protein
VTDYVAPAAKALTVLHLKDPCARDSVASPDRLAAIGMTMCGEPMVTADLWMLLEREPRDKVCSRCLDPGSGDEDQGTLL